MKKTTLQEWIREALTDEDKRNEKNEIIPCSAMVLFHNVAGGGETEIHSVRFGGSAQPRTEYELATLFRSKAQVYSQDLVGVQSFQLIALYGNDAEAKAYYVFRINGKVNLTTENGTTETESPTGTGMVSQAMRHTEASLQMALGSIAKTNDFMMQVLDKVTAMNERLMTENADSFSIIKTLLVEKYDREKVLREEQEQKQKDLLNREAFYKLAPALINTISGREVFPQSTADTSLVETIAKQIKPEQLDSLIQMLPPTVLLPLMNRFASVKTEQENAIIKGNVSEELGIKNE